jgi:mRNA interferase RelE/StbE
LKKIDKSVLIFFEKALKKIQKSPELWKKLWNKQWIDLSGYNKIYFASKKYRIVYKVDNNEIKVYVVSVWKRENMNVYRQAFERILKWE